ncbi:hypothetical protein SDRG_14230 [Saprolegnia diclina VS20]|uniref:Uncharacterized protein n=1 Tax=Saprolegnia diclina (strain VS20) TaxID=1156394 RepID=T0R7E4_SAPDV|nr:hypothetical protein SDRG_14230 [Saprolegnia diclina VS20]EQC27953.1 hypothetical protein SDRG_14230 [Saprolegnia diclina VS20]|eukprot:XP_008618566.1 hypothetical protein SDRG_14230 [Saprolegnia diclina VS20]
MMTIARFLLIAAAFVAGQDATDAPVVSALILAPTPAGSGAGSQEGNQDALVGTGARSSTDFRDQGNDNNSRGTRNGGPTSGYGALRVNSGYGNQGASYGKQGAGYGNQGAGYGKQGAGYGNQGAGYGNQGADYGKPAYGLWNSGAQAGGHGQRTGLGYGASGYGRGNGYGGYRL